MPYVPVPSPGAGDLNALHGYVQAELQKISEAINGGRFQSIRLDQLGSIDHLPRPRNGDLAFFLDGAGTPDEQGGLHLFGGGFWALIPPLQRAAVDMIRPEPATEAGVLGSGTAWVSITEATDIVPDPAGGWTHDGNGALTVVLPAGTIADSIAFSMTISATLGVNINQQYTLGITLGVNGVPLTGIAGYVDIRSNSDRTQVIAHGSGELQDGDVLTVMVKNITEPAEVQIRQVHMQAGYVVSLEAG